MNNPPQHTNLTSKLTVVSSPNSNTHLDGNMKTAQVTHIDKNNVVLNGNIAAKQALSCLVRPQLGDLVLYFKADNHAWVTAILSGKSNNEMTQEMDSNGRKGALKDRIISLSNNQGMSVETRSFNVNASEDISLHAVNKVQFTAVLGQLSISAKSLVQSIQDSCIQLAKHWLNRAEYIDQEAEKVIKTHAQHQLMTAQKDVKVDAQRINMG